MEWHVTDAHLREKVSFDIHFEYVNPLKIADYTGSNFLYILENIFEDK